MTLVTLYYNIIMVLKATSLQRNEDDLMFYIATESSQPKILLKCKYSLILIMCTEPKISLDKRNSPIKPNYLFALHKCSVLPIIIRVKVTISSV